MKNYIPLKVEFCLYDSILCGKILQQDDRLINQVTEDDILIAGNSPFYSHHLSIVTMPDLCDYTLYLRGKDKDEDNSAFCYNYINKKDAETALKNFKELIKQVNKYYNEIDTTKTNTYFVEVCE